MNLYFLNDELSEQIVYVGTAVNLGEFVKIFNHHLYNIHIVTDYYQEAKLEKVNGKNFLQVIEGYHSEELNKEYKSTRYLIKVRQYAPDRVYDLTV